MSSRIIDTERGAILIRQGKGKKDRMVPVGERAAAWIEKYLYEARAGLVVGPVVSRDISPPACRALS
jgi:integrase/recombinase XerD